MAIVKADGTLMCSPHATHTQHTLNTTNEIHMTLREFLKKVLFANPKKTHVMDPMQRSDGPGLAILVWAATKKLVDELEFDCRGKVDLLSMGRKGQLYGKAVVMGGEIKRSSTGQATRGNENCVVCCAGVVCCADIRCTHRVCCCTGFLCVQLSQRRSCS
jgi:hypothetical protein